MKALVSYLLVLLLFTGSFFPQMDVEEVYKIPWLFSHYQEHKAQASADFDFWDFLVMHYAPGSPHAKLPHKGVAIPLYNHLSLGFLFIIAIPILFRLIRETTWLESASEVYQNSYSYLFSLSLLHPPQGR